MPAGLSACAAAAALLASLSGAWAQPAPAPSPSPGERACDEDRAAFAISQPYSTELAERARQAAGARLSRKVEPGGAYTMELRPDRLNIEVDRRDVVQRVRCG
jgi:Peptidase inhibitor I78 family